ncbi:hypothetical protein [Magnetococcus sp. PR-3]|uniref:hypothetical protein n=1 Tax=Magnetococcus sp. PR-3 TaxID=3120355 RepID=UPI002FCE0BDC
MRIVLILVVLVLVVIMTVLGLRHLWKARQGEVIEGEVIDRPEEDLTHNRTAQRVLALLLGLMLVGAIVHLVETSNGPAEHYTPARLENGQIIPGELK